MASELSAVIAEGALAGVAHIEGMTASDVKRGFWKDCGWERETPLGPSCSRKQVVDRERNSDMGQECSLDPELPGSTRN